MKSIAEIRRENTRQLKDSMQVKTLSAFAKKIDRAETMLSRYIGKNPKQNIGDDLARHIEKCFNKPTNWLDTQHIKMDSYQNESQFGNITVKENTQDYQTLEELGTIRTQYRRVPVVGMAKLGDDGYFDEQQYPVGHGDGYIDHPTQDPNAYALKTVGDSMFPTIRHGWYVIIEPNLEFYPGMLALVKLLDGRKMIKEVTRSNDGFYTLHSVNEDHARITLHETEVEDIQPVGGIIPPNKVSHP